jgi:hypothetical protein
MKTRLTVLKNGDGHPSSDEHEMHGVEICEVNARQRQTVGTRFNYRVAVIGMCVRKDTMHTANGPPIREVHGVLIGVIVFDDVVAVSGTEKEMIRAAATEQLVISLAA